MTQKIPSWVWLAGLAGVGYALYKLSDTVRQGLNTVTAPVSDVIANVINALDPNMAPGAQVVGSAVFPNGAQVPLSNLQVRASGSGNNFQALVTYQGRTYSLSQHDANGNYPATPV